MGSKQGNKQGNNQLRLEQYETVLYNANINPMGVPASVKKALADNIDNIIRYPMDYYGELKKAIAEYSGCNPANIMLGNGSSDLLRMFITLIAPKKAMLLTPSSSEYEKILRLHGCEIDYYELNEDDEYRLDLVDFVGQLDSSYDMIILGNPNNPTSQIIDREDMKTLSEVCKTFEAFLIIDEMYIEFCEDYKELTSTPLAESYNNIAIFRSVSKFFAVPGLRLAYAIMNNPEKMNCLVNLVSPNNISSLTAAACIPMFKDSAYIEESRSQIYTERNLIYSAMSTSKSIKLFKPYANFMLAKILKEDVTSGAIAEHCNLKGIVIRNCDNIRGLDNRFIRFCFMKPNQNDLLVNSILEML
ncbi:MAG: pyridoxal phosphate-dependent aminotransferase [Wujia sp.]